MPDVAARRLRTQRLTGERFATADEAVGWLAAVQSQDYAGAKWALGQRVAGLTDRDTDRLYDAGAILRTHVLRPTWHFVLPDDVRWLLDLTAPRVRMRLTPMDGRLETDGPLRARSQRAMERALGDGHHLTRAELGAALERAGIPATGMRLGHLVMYAELDGLIVSGARRGRQHTYALLAERAPHARRLTREEALGELALRYFRSHGPAQPQDFAWWSGLTIADARRGLALAGSALVEERVVGRSYWTDPHAPPPADEAPAVHLLPNYDEFLVAYRDRSDALDPARGLDTTPFPGGSVLAHVVVLRGQVWGCWRRRAEARQTVVALGPLDVLDPDETVALERAAEDLGRFLGAPVVVEPAPTS